MGPQSFSPLKNLALREPLVATRILLVGQQLCSGAQLPGWLSHRRVLLPERHKPRWSSYLISVETEQPGSDDPARAGPPERTRSARLEPLRPPRGGLTWIDVFKTPRYRDQPQSIKQRVRAYRWARATRAGRGAASHRGAASDPRHNDRLLDLSTGGAVEAGVPSSARVLQGNEPSSAHALSATAGPMAACMSSVSLIVHAGTLRRRVCPLQLDGWLQPHPSHISCR